MNNKSFIGQRPINRPSQVKVDPTQYPVTHCPKCGSIDYLQVVRLHKVPGVVLGSPQDVIIPEKMATCSVCYLARIVLAAKKGGGSGPENKNEKGPGSWPPNSRDES